MTFPTKNIHKILTEGKIVVLCMLSISYAVLFFFLRSFQPRVEKILFIDVTEDSMMIQEVVIGDVGFSSQASTVASHLPDIWTRPEESEEKFPASELEDIKHEIEEDLKGMEAEVRSTGSRLDRIEDEQEKLRDMQEMQHDVCERKINELNDEELDKIKHETDEMINEEKSEIHVGDDLEREAQELMKEKESVHELALSQVGPNESVHVEILKKESESENEPKEITEEIKVVEIKDLHEANPQNREENNNIEQKSTDIIEETKVIEDV